MFKRTLSRHRFGSSTTQPNSLAIASAVVMALFSSGATAEDSSAPAVTAQPNVSAAPIDTRTTSNAAADSDTSTASNSAPATIGRRAPKPDTAPSTATHLPKSDEPKDSSGTATTQTKSSDASTSANASPGTKTGLGPAALPVGGDKSGVTTKTLSIPKGSGSIEGMGESFSAQLSTGIATFSVPFALPKARGAAQPGLGLSYSSGSGQGLAGLGWDVGVPFIARQTDRGLPKYIDEAEWHAEQDRFVYNGGQELVPICTVSAARTCSGSITQGLTVGSTSVTLTETMPAWAAGWQYFRPRVEGSFLRFFWSPDHRTWRVQDKNGVTLELGVPLDDASYLSALDRNPDPTNAAASGVKEEIYRWHLVRQFDVHGAGNASVVGAPSNVVLYRYVQDGGQALLTDIYDTPPASTGAPTLADFAHHAHLRYEARSDPTVSYRSGWKIEQTQRLVGVDVTSKTFGVESGTTRNVVRRYHLSYATGWHQSLLEGVQVEGRCGAGESNGAGEDAGGLVAATACPRLPAMVFSYQHVQPFTTAGKTGVADLDGYEGFDERIQVMSKSPKHSLDEQLTDLFDINSDGLSDVLVTAPGLYGPGHGVFFNGSGGIHGFGGVVQMGVSGINGADANTITLRNLNVSTLDLDGDGRVNFLHMPMVKTYSVYDAVNSAGKWSWAGRSIATATRQNPKIDFGKDSVDIQVVDVNFDGLVDVVYSSGTELQTFFSLGRYPGGDGQFGNATRTGPIASSISNDPVTTCVPYAGLPVRFSDKETKLADMNGDGIVDIVRLQRGQIRYWPGRGNGFFGNGRRDDCKAGTFGANRYEEMAQSPQYSDIEGDSLRLDDVNGDGLSDLVQIRYDAVDVWLNVDGVGWTTRHIIDGSPYSPSYANRVRLTDINGSGTPDILWGNAENFQYMDLTGGKKPGLLTAVANGLGKTTTLEYSTSTEEMLVAESHAACPETGVPAGSDAWNYAWCKKMPAVAHVVKRVTESDNLIAAGQGPSSIMTEYEYRDPVYEGRQREFRGFERARARRLGDANSPTDVSESWFLLGECMDITPSDGRNNCSLENRWDDNPMEALKGLPIVTEKQDLSGRTLSTDVTTYELRKLYEGRDGRSVRHAVATGTSSYVYDTSATFSGGAAIDFDVVTGVELVSSAGSTPVEGTGTPLISKSVMTRSSAHALIQAESSVDFFGNQLVAAKHGCVSGCADTTAGVSITADETLYTVTMPTQVTGDDTGWLFRTGEGWIAGSLHGANRYGYQRTTYDSLGRPTQVQSELQGSVGLLRSHVFAGATDGLFVAATTTYDDYGNPTRVTGANDRCSTLSYDPSYAQLPISETVYRSAGCTNPLVMGASAYDRGFGLVTLALDLNNQPTQVVYDEFGRTKELYKPLPDSGTLSTHPSVQIEYYLPPNLGTNISAIHTLTEDGATIGDGEFLESWAYVDGFGRTRTTLSEADPTVDDGANWVVSGLVTHDAKGAVQRKHIEYFYTGTAETFSIASAPTTPYGSQRYDAFGRAVQTFDLDGTMTLRTVYHALGSDMWDAADLSNGPHAGTYASERKDGHGRTIRVTERAHNATSVELRHVLTEYSPTGQPEVIRRRLGNTNASDVVRWMRYDSLGRMVLNVDGHTSSALPNPPDPSTALAGYTRPTNLKAWTYRYNLAGDLIGTEDARGATGSGGCGVNFSYDALGRLLGEDYDPCDSSQEAYSAPSGNSGWEVAYYYDAPPTVGAQVPGDICTPSSYAAGRLVTVRDRAAETTTCVDGRGRVIVSARRVGTSLGATEDVAEAMDTRYTTQWFSKQAAYDAADRPYAETTGGLRGMSIAEFTGRAESVFTGNVQDTQVVRTNYTRRGTVKDVGGSYGTLVASIQRRADGLVTNLVYGDSAGTQTSTTYDDRRRPVSIQTYRAGSPLWSAFAPGGTPITNVTYSPAPAVAGTATNFQMLLEDTDIAYDEVGNPVELRDWREPSEWPASNKPVTKKIEYDDLYRVRRMDYLYATSTGTDGFQSPFSKENSENPNSPPDTRRARAVPQLSFTNRPAWQRFEYDWLGNLAESDDDAHGGWDRSLGVQQHTNANKPYQLRTATNSSFAGTGGLIETVTTKYDSAGNLTRLGVVRPAGKCAQMHNGTAMANPPCSQFYAYDYDEVGRLFRARRWDSSATSYDAESQDVGALGTPAIDLRHRYDASDQRVVKRIYDATAANQRHTLYLFGSLEVRRTTYASDAYGVTNATLVPYLMAHGVRLARLHYSGPTTSPQVSGSAVASLPYNTNAPATLHVLLELGDHLGSTATVLDKVTSELVEKATYLPFGARENDYRQIDGTGGSNRWTSFREDYGFTGKEEDVEVGLTYFGKRFLAPQLGRWVSRDPLAVHAPGQADFNLYAYVHGQVLRSTDPVGLLDTSEGSAGREFLREKATAGAARFGYQDAHSSKGTAQPAESYALNDSAVRKRLGFDPNLPLEDMAADHIVSFKELADNEAFRGLTLDQQMAVLRNKDNLAMLAGDVNKSKGGLSLDQYMAKKGLTDPRLQALADRARSSTSAQIEDYAKFNREMGIDVPEQDALAFKRWADVSPGMRKSPFVQKVWSDIKARLAPAARAQIGELPVPGEVTGTPRGAMRENLRPRTGRILSGLGHVLGLVGDLLLYWDFKEGRLPGPQVNPCAEGGDPHQCGS